MSIEAIKVNALLCEAADFCRQKSQEIRGFIEEGVWTEEFIALAANSADYLRNIVEDICDLTLDEED